MDSIISMFVDVLITTAGVERVTSPLYGADFSYPTVLGALIDQLIDMLLAAMQVSLEDS